MYRAGWIALLVYSLTCASVAKGIAILGNDIAITYWDKEFSPIFTYQISSIFEVHPLAAVVIAILSFVAAAAAVNRVAIMCIFSFLN